MYNLHWVVNKSSHPTVGVAHFGSKVSDGLSSLGEEPADAMKNLLLNSS